jgi:tRNA modification GTPase
VIQLPDTLVACLTPPGVGAIATLGLRGPRAWAVVREPFRPAGNRPFEPVPGRFSPGRLGGDLADEVVVTVLALEPVPSVEVHCHGGREVVRMLLEDFQARGVRVCSWPEFERAGAADALQADALVALTQACTERAAAILLDQYHGALGRAIHAIEGALHRGELAEAERLTEELARYSRLGRHLTQPWRVVIAGAPNVGKSSLANALAGFARCLVSPIPGTTRDLVTTLIAVEGWPVELVDTAGLRDEAAPLEQQGIGLARDAARTADLCLWVLDASDAPVWPEGAGENVRLVINKCDLPPAWDPHLAVAAIRISALTGAGLDDLCSAMARWLVPEVPPAGAAVPFTPALCSRFSREPPASAGLPRSPEARG